MLKLYWLLKIEIIEILLLLSHFYFKYLKSNELI